MKKSRKTILTALMFTSAAISLGVLSTSCGVYGPAPEEIAGTPEQELTFEETEPMTGNVLSEEITS